MGYWKGSLTADIMIIGQDWFNLDDGLREFDGNDLRKLYHNKGHLEKDKRTNGRMYKLMKEAGIGDATFYDWLLNNQDMGEATCRNYVSAINRAEHFAEEYDYNHSKLYTNDFAEAKATANELFLDPIFMKYNDPQHNRLSAGITKLLRFPGGAYGDGFCSTLQQQGVNMEPYERVLSECFTKGFRVGSLIEMRKFKRCFEESTGVIPKNTDEVIEQIFVVVAFYMKIRLIILRLCWMTM